MCESAGLPSISIDTVGLALQRSADEARHYYSVAPRLPWRHRIEEPNDDHRHPILLPIGLGQEFIYDFGRSITPSPPTRRPEHKVIIFRKFRSIRLSIDLRRRKLDHQFFLLARKFQDDFGP